MSEGISTATDFCVSETSVNSTFMASDTAKDTLTLFQELRSRRVARTRSSRREGGSTIKPKPAQRAERRALADDPLEHTQALCACGARGGTRTPTAYQATGS